MSITSLQHRLMSQTSLSTVSLLLSLMATETTLAQADSALGFFPLNTGDLHQFHNHYSTWDCSVFPPVLVSHSSHHLEQVLEDTLLATGFLYKIVTSDMPQELPLQYLRVDTSSANVYRFQSDPVPHDVLVDSLRASPGTWFTREEWMPTECTGVDTATILGVLTTVKHFRAMYIPGAEYSLAYGLGRVQYVTFEDDFCYPVLDYFYRDLVFARIDSNDHGTYVSASEPPGSSPSRFVLRQNYPNPFNPTTTIDISVPHTADVRVTILDLLGREIVTLVTGELEAGEHSFTWKATGLASGVYFYRLSTAGIVQTKRLMVLK
jgi:hypothetical protein